MVDSCHNICVTNQEPRGIRHLHAGSVFYAETPALKEDDTTAAISEVRRRENGGDELSVQHSVRSAKRTKAASVPAALGIVESGAATSWSACLLV